MAIRGCLTPSMSDDPYFSIVLATYGRGRRIVPTIESVLGQSFAAFELIVVGDGCDDDTEDAVKAFNAAKISWRNLTPNSGSQSFPNNVGIDCARGAWICYIGHDDIWAPDHLAQLHAAIGRDGAADFAVSGCIYYGPPGSEIYYVNGLFDDSNAAYDHFFPPTSFAHRRDVIDRIGGWRDPRSISVPVDYDLLHRAARDRLRFVSTGRVTAHKFAAGHRYLSYLRQSDEEQRALLASFDRETERRNARIIEMAKSAGTYMIPHNRYIIWYQNYLSWIRKGRQFNNSRASRGLDRPPLRPLSQRSVIAQSDEPRALDWYRREGTFRWSGPNPRPRILIPFTGGRAQAAIRIAGMARDSRPEDLSVFVEDRETAHALTRDTDGSRWLRFVVPLSRHDYTVVRLHTPAMFARRRILRPPRRSGVAIGEIVLDPLS